LVTVAKLRFQIAIVLFAAAAWACDTSKPGASPGSSTVAGTPKPAGSVPVPGESIADSGISSPELDQWISQLAKGVDTNVTLGMWLAGHADDSVSRTVPTGMHPELLCRSTAAPIRAGDRLWRGSAVFVIPPRPPAGESLPDTSRVAERLCRLRALWLESAEKDSLRARAVALALRVRLSRELGPGRPKVLMTGVGTGIWRAGESWVNGRRVVVTGILPGGSGIIRRETDPARLNQRDTIVAVSFMTGNGMDTTFPGRIDRMESPEVEPERPRGLARADSAIEWSGMSGLLPLRRLFALQWDSVHVDKTVQSTADSILLQVLAALRDSSTLPSPQRSAAFLAADLAVQMYYGELDNKPDTVLRLQLEQLGARYDFDQLGMRYVYLRPWLWRAYQLDSLGPAGRSAFAELLGQGWSTAVGCPDGPDRTGEVISRGERALADGSADPMVRLYVAEAYGDRFSGSQMGENFYELPTVSPREGEQARRLAIEHYRTVLASIRDRSLRRTIWSDAVRLMLRLPIEMHFYCVYD
jgi:hypothetical protein